MLYEEFAERIADWLEARSRSAGEGIATTRAALRRSAATMARQEAAAVTKEEAPPPEAQA